MLSNIGIKQISNLKKKKKIERKKNVFSLVWYKAR